jgi:hypothetical protein
MLTRLSSLKCLVMDYVDLSSIWDWVHKVNMLPNLQVLSLHECNLHSTVSTDVSHSNLTHLEPLEVLDLSENPQISPFFKGAFGWMDKVG